MKRSEVLEFLKQEIEAMIYLYELGGLDYEESARLMLNCLEHHIGMKPPSTSGPVIIGTDSRTGEAAAYDISKNSKNMWEMEDEEYSIFLKHMESKL